MTSPHNHLFIPDTQVRPGLRLDYLRWAGQYAVDHFIAKKRPVKLIQIGDFWDMPSLSRWDAKGGVRFEGRRVARDIQAGNDGWDAFMEPIDGFLNDNSRMKRWYAENVEGHFFFGNHEDHITRAIDGDASLDGLLSLDMLKTPAGWKRHPYLKPVTLDGVTYSHFFQNKNTGRALSGENLGTRLKNLGFSFTQGHQQDLQVAIRFVNGQMQRGLVAGAYYVHNEDYKGFQGNAHWRGLIVKHDLDGRGGYGLMEVGIDYLCRRYEGVSFSKYRTRHYS